MKDLWNDVSVLPKFPGRYSVKLSSGDEAVSFYDPSTGWAIGKPIEKWFHEPVPVDADGAVVLTFNGDDFIQVSADEIGFLEDDEDAAVEMEAIRALLSAPDAVRDIGVRVSRYFMVKEDANTYSAGRVVAVGVSYAAQHVVGGDVVIHENARLSRQVSPGDEVTIVYNDGDGLVLPGIFQKYEIDIEIPCLPKDTVDRINALVKEEIAASRVNINDADQVLAAVERCVEFATCGGKPDWVKVVYIDKITRDVLDDPLRFGGGKIDTERYAGMPHRHP